jgi:hypothetical protein
MGVTVASAAVLWIRQTPGATMHVGSFGRALGAVLLFGFPGLIAFVLIPTRWWGIAASAAVLAGLMVSDWWASSTTWHSTASLGPAITGWIIVPSLLVAGGLASWVVHMGREGVRQRLGIRSSRRGRRMR